MARKAGGPDMLSLIVLRWRFGYNGLVGSPVP